MSHIYHPFLLVLYGHIAVCVCVSVVLVCCPTMKTKGKVVTAESTQLTARSSYKDSTEFAVPVYTLS